MKYAYKIFSLKQKSSRPKESYLIFCKSFNFSVVVSDGKFCFLQITSLWNYSFFIFEVQFCSFVIKVKVIRSIKKICRPSTNRISISRRISGIWPTTCQIWWTWLHQLLSEWHVFFIYLVLGLALTKYLVSDIAPAEYLVSDIAPAEYLVSDIAPTEYLVSGLALPAENPVSGRIV